MRRRDTSMFKTLQAIDKLGATVTNKQIVEWLGGKLTSGAVAGAIKNLKLNEMIEQVGLNRDRRLFVTEFGCEVLADNVPHREPMRHSGESREVQCLSCRRPFHSEGVFTNRICSACKSNDEWKSSAAAAHVMQEAR